MIDASGIRTPDDYKKALETLVSNINSISDTENKPWECDIEHEPVFVGNISDIPCDPISTSTPTPGDIISDAQIISTDLKNLDGITSDAMSALKSANDDSVNFANKLKECIYGGGGDGYSSIQSISDKAKSDVELMQKLMQTRDAYVELTRNMSMLYRYHMGKISGFNSREINLPAIFNSIFTKASTIGNKLGKYSECIEYKFNSSAFNAETFSISGDIMSYTFLFTRYDDIHESYTSKLLTGGNVKEHTFDEGHTITGKLYEEFYNKMDEPVDNFFTLEERGLTTNVSEAQKTNNDGITGLSKEEMSKMDDLTTVKYKTRDVYVRNSDKHRKFYEELPNEINDRLNEYFDTHIAGDMEKLCSDMEEIGYYYGAFTRIKGGSISDSTGFIKDYEDLTDKDKGIIASIEARIKSLSEATSKDAIIAEIRKNPCFQDAKDQNDRDIEQEIDMVGPMQTIFGSDPKNPNQWDDCYWIVFSRHATQYGATLPLYPDMKNPVSFQYWSVGMMVPTPAGLVKVPFPIVWIPLVTIDSPMGVVVLFIGMCGITPNIYVFYAGNDGTKKFAITMRGPSEPFGYKEECDTPKMCSNLGLPWPSISLNPECLLDIPKIVSGNYAQYLSNENEYYARLKADGLCLLPPQYLLQFGLDKIDIRGWILDLRDKLIRFIMQLDFVKLLTTMSLDEIKQIVHNFINSLPFPYLKIPPWMDTFKVILPVLKLIDTVKELFAFKLELKPIFKSLRDVLKILLLKVLHSNKITELINKLPGNITIGEEFINEFEELKDTMVDILDIAIDAINPNNFANLELFTALYNKKLNISLFGCYKQFTIPAIDPLGALNALFENIKSLLKGINLGDFLSINPRSFTRNMIMDILMNIIDNIIPDVDIPAGLNTNLADLMKLLAAPLAVLSSIKIEPGIPLIQPIVIDTSVYKDKILDMFDGWIDSLEEMSDNLSDQVKQQIYKIIETIIDPDSTIMKPLITSLEAILKPLVIMNNVHKLMKDLGLLDSILDPEGLAKKLGEIAIAAASSLVDFNMSHLVIDSDKLKEAYEKLAKAKVLNYVVIGVGCTYVGPPFKRIIRLMHPILRQDDLPPFERLTLDNMLFVLFLDDFCRVAKRHTIFGDTIV